MLEEIATDMTTPPLLLTDMTVGQMAAVLQRAKLALGVDSGPLHLAVAQGTPTIHIFGPTDPRIFGPWGLPERNVVIASTHRCPTCPSIPCGRLDFRPEELPAHPCVRLVSEQQVLEVIKTVLHMEATTPTHTS
jgi:ADP-heptose:LPS heptosyltransferase